MVSWHERAGNHQRVQGGNSKGHNGSTVGKCQTQAFRYSMLPHVRTANGKGFFLTFLWVRPFSTARTLCISAADGSGFQLCMLCVFVVVCASEEFTKSQGMPSRDSSGQLENSTAKRFRTGAPKQLSCSGRCISKRCPCGFALGSLKISQFQDLPVSIPWPPLRQDLEQEASSIPLDDELVERSQSGFFMFPDVSSRCDYVFHVDFGF